MRVSDFDDLDHFETEGLLTGSKERNWLWLGLIVSLAIHFALCTYFYRTRFESADAVFAQNEQTPTFKVKRVLDSNLDKSSADQIDPAAKPDPDNTDVQLPDEKKSFDKLLQEIQASTALPDDMRDVLPDQPKVEQSDVNSVLNEIERSTAQTLSNDPNAAQTNRCLTTARRPAVRSLLLAEPNWPPARQLNGPILSRASCPATALGRTKDTHRASAIWTSCWRKKARSGQAQNCDCRTTNFSSTTATCCNRAPSVNCKSLARLSSATRKRHFPWKATRIRSARLNTI